MTGELLSDPRLREYLEDVRLWHGYVRFLGLPTLQDRPDTPLADLFVPPALSAQRVAPEAESAEWPPGEDVVAALAEHRRLVVLGDPGSGKSTLVNWLAWLLASGESAHLPGDLAGRLPIPLVPRELRLSQLDGFDGLLQAFLARPVAQAFRGDAGVLREYLAQGRVLLLVDGLDEVGLDPRRALREALRDGWQRHPGTSLLATSRIVGYDECPLDPAAEPAAPHADPRVAAVMAEAARRPRRQLAAPGVDIYLNGAETRTPLRYVMPFDDARIRAFAHRWYGLRSIKQLADVDSDAFSRALLAEPGVNQLARTPQLLTLMALVYRVRSQLPDGRALLYDMITEAYLESIDLSRALPSDPYPWREKRRWLARVGFEMQMLRSQGHGEGAPPTTATVTAERELLVSRAQVLAWLRTAMTQSGYAAADAGFAEAYLDWVARRSGLLLPRGEDRFAFVHLSFQEYFAALYLQEHLADADWVIAQRDGTAYEDGDERVSAAQLAAWAGDRLWQETLVFAQEGCAENPRAARRLAGWLFGGGYEALPVDVVPLPADQGRFGRAPPAMEAAHARAELLARMVANPHSGLAGPERDRAMEALVRYLQQVERRFEAGTYGYPRGGALKRLLGNADARGALWRALSASRFDIMNLEGGGSVDANELAGMTWLRDLMLEEISNTDMAPFASLPRLALLHIWSAPRLVSLEPVGRLTGLRNLIVWNAPLPDLAPLAPLVDLEYLTLVPIAGPATPLTELDDPPADDPRLDLAPIEHLPRLRTLWLWGEQPLTPALEARAASGALEIVRYGVPKAPA